MVLMHEDKMIAGLVPKEGIDASDVSYESGTVKDALDKLSGIVKKQSYGLSAESIVENCFVTSLGRNYQVVIGVVPKNRDGWNLIARVGVSGTLFPSAWVITTSDGSALSGTFEFDVYYIDIT